MVEYFLMFWSLVVVSLAVTGNSQKYTTRKYISGIVIECDLHKVLHLEERLMKCWRRILRRDLSSRSLLSWIVSCLALAIHWEAMSLEVKDDQRQCISRRLMVQDRGSDPRICQEMLDPKLTKWHESRRGCSRRRREEISESSAWFETSLTSWCWRPSYCRIIILRSAVSFFRALTICVENYCLNGQPRIGG